MSAQNVQSGKNQSAHQKCAAGKEAAAGKKQSVDREGRRRDAAVDTEKAPGEIGNRQKHREQNDNRQNAACRKTAEIFA